MAILHEAQPVRRQGLVRAAGALGQTVEWYDYYVYAYFATEIAQTFFPSKNPTTSLISAFAVFASTFLARPFGALVIGHFTDRLGRRGAFSVTIIGAAVATAIIGAIPGASHIGAGAAVILVLCRLAQGAFVGGEWPTSGAMVVEHSANQRRAFGLSFVQMGGTIGSIIALLVATIVSAAVGEAHLTQWGWRIPFLIALPLGVVGLYIRLRLSESPAFERVEQRQEVAVVPVAELFTSGRYLRRMALMVGILIGNFYGFYIFLTYVPSYLLTHTSVGPNETYLASTLSQIFLLLLIAPLALLCDRVGRRPFLFGYAILFIVLPIPVFLIMGKATFGWILLAELIIMLPIATYQAVQDPIMLELVPTRLRVSGAGIAFAVAGAIFGGTAPLVAIWLVGKTGTTVSVAITVMVAAAISLVVALFVPETAHQPLEDR